MFTDADGRPVLSLAGGVRVIGEDPAEIAQLAERLLAGEEEVTA